MAKPSADGSCQFCGGRAVQMSNAMHCGRLNLCNTRSAAHVHGCVIVWVRLYLCVRVSAHVWVSVFLGLCK